jgi:threonine synthase
LKIDLARRLGAEVITVDGGRAAASAAALREASEGAFYASHAWSPFFLQGTKTLAYAMTESMGWTAPETVVVPCGNGGLVLGLDMGFRELRRHGLIEHRPAIVAVQAARCAPIRAAYAHNLTEPNPVAEGPTIADGIRVGAPPRGVSILRAVRESGGFVDTVDDEEIEKAQSCLWNRGYAVEPTAAVGIALLLRPGNPLPKRQGNISFVLTGSGLKTPPEASEP